MKIGLKNSGEFLILPPHPSVICLHERQVLAAFPLMQLLHYRNGGEKKKKDELTCDVQLLI